MVCTWVIDSELEYELEEEMAREEELSPSRNKAGIRGGGSFEAEVGLADRLS